MIIREKAYPRAGLIGNPSDGYYGKTIAFAFTNFSAEIVLYESPELEIIPNTRDHSVFRSIAGLAEDVELFGYYGGIRLLKAAIRRFYAYCRERDYNLHRRNFTIRYRTDIPHLVGLGGSSAIITACLRALMRFYEIRIPQPEQANLILAVEAEELGIAAGLQDRVAQVYEGLMYMDFDRAHMDAQGYGRYERLDAGLLPNLYIAYRMDLSEGSEIFHSNMRDRFERGDAEVLEAVRFWIGLTETVRELLETGRGNAIGPQLDANFDRRAAIYRISEGNRRMIEAARGAGASAKFTGSGGAVIGCYEDKAVFNALRRALEPMNIRIIKPIPAPAAEEDDT
ncbi:MAG: GHMP kinase [Lentisphaerae bacterium]|nr:GHMP kinase [Lentisphaerota bacterium]